MKQAAESFVPGTKQRDDVASAESMSSPFEKQMCDHTQFTQDMFRVKEGDRKKTSPQVFC
jgi:hypothetical protein